MKAVVAAFNHERALVGGAFLLDYTTSIFANVRFMLYLGLDAGGPEVAHPHPFHGDTVHVLHTGHMKHTASQQINGAI